MRELLSTTDVKQLSDETIGIDETQERLMELVDISEVMSRKYWVICTNPPYMGYGGMDYKLSEFIKQKYPDSKSDLFAVFIEKCQEMILKNGYQSMITQHSWMFLSSYESLRKKLHGEDIISLCHLGPRAFDEIAGEVVQTVSFVIRKAYTKQYKGLYSRLVSQESQSAKEKAFLDRENMYCSSWKQFERIPGSPVVYWASEEILKAFEESALKNTCIIAQGLITGNTKKFTRLWFEIRSGGICSKYLEYIYQS